MTTYSDQQNKYNNYSWLFGGIVSLILGLLLFTRTEASLAVVMLLLGLTWFIQGIFILLSIFIDKSEWGWKLFGGVIGIAAGLLVFQYPVESTVAVPAILAIIMGIFGIIIGIAFLIDAFKGGGWGEGVFGVISIIIGALLLFNSAVGGQVLVWLMALLLVIQGVVGIYYGFKSR